MSLQVELLERSFNYIKPYGDLFVSSFYENLFKNNSEIQSLLINTDSETQQTKFWESLVLVMENLRQPAILKNTLQGFGARLFTDGILSEHYPLGRDAFLATFAQFLGNEWTAEFEQAWKDAYVDFRELMLEGAEKAHKQINSKKTTIESGNNIPPTTKIPAIPPITKTPTIPQITRTPKISPATETSTIFPTTEDEFKNQVTVNSPSESQSTATATAIATATESKVKSIIDDQTKQPEYQESKSNRIFFISGGIAGVIGILLLIILL